MQYITYSMSFQLCRLIAKRSSGYLTRYPAPVCKLTDSIHRISFPPTVPCTLAPRIKKHRLNKSLDLQNRAPFAFALCDRIEFHAVGTAPGCRFVRKIVRLRQTTQVNDKRVSLSHHEKTRLSVTETAHRRYKA